ncbi:MAG: hypothetical protein HS122_15490 [Opitutaceae bacterium]|nr:hypothetical protein [Opitutaceae bacterium]
MQGSLMPSAPVSTRLARVSSTILVTRPAGGDGLTDGLRAVGMVPDSHFMGHLHIRVLDEQQHVAGKLARIRRGAFVIALDQQGRIIRSAARKGIKGQSLPSALRVRSKNERMEDSGQGEDGVRGRVLSCYQLRQQQEVHVQGRRGEASV